jgi:hypothetical protein
LALSDAERIIEKISSLVGGYSSAPEVRASFLDQLRRGVADPAATRSVMVGLELALDIMKEELGVEPRRTD